MDPITYVKQGWKNKEEEGAIPVNDNDLNHIEDGIFTVTERANGLGTALDTVEDAIANALVVEDTYPLLVDELVGNNYTDLPTASIPGLFDGYWTHAYIKVVPNYYASDAAYCHEIVAPIVDGTNGSQQRRTVRALRSYSGSSTGLGIAEIATVNLGIYFIKTENPISATATYSGTLSTRFVSVTLSPRDSLGSPTISDDDRDYYAGQPLTNFFAYYKNFTEHKRFIETVKLLRIASPIEGGNQ